jgi:hypothetical protein
MAKKTHETLEPSTETTAASADAAPAEPKNFKKTEAKSFPDYVSARSEFDDVIKKVGKEGPKNKTRVRVRRRPSGLFEVITYVR